MYVSKSNYFSDCYRTMFRKEDTFSSPNYLVDSHDDEHCEYLIMQPKGNIISMEFIVFQLEDDLEDRCYNDRIMVGS